MARAAASARIAGSGLGQLIDTSFADRNRRSHVGYNTGEPLLGETEPLAARDHPRRDSSKPWLASVLVVDPLTAS